MTTPLEEACAAIPHCAALPFSTVMAAWKRCQQRHTTLAQTLAGIHISVTAPANPPGNVLAITLACSCLVLVGIIAAWGIFGKRDLFHSTMAPPPPDPKKNP